MNLEFVTFLFMRLLYFLFCNFNIFFSFNPQPSHHHPRKTLVRSAAVTSVPSPPPSQYPDEVMEVSENIFNSWLRVITPSNLLCRFPNDAFKGQKESNLKKKIFSSFLMCLPGNFAAQSCGLSIFSKRLAKMPKSERYIYIDPVPFHSHDPNVYSPTVTDCNNISF